MTWRPSPWSGIRHCGKSAGEGADARSLRCAVATVAVHHRQRVPASGSHELQEVAIEVLGPVVPQRVRTEVGDAA